MDARNTVAAVLTLNELVRTYRQGDREIRVLDGATAQLYQGQAVALVGPSGAGKSTLLHVAGLLETPDGGEVHVNGRDCAGMSDEQRTAVRRTEMGFVYQFHQLLPEFSAEENVMMPQMIRGRQRSVARERARELLGMLGLSKRLDHRPAELSGGEQQRTAIARALANEPHLLLADEPTGNLDSHTSQVIHRLFVELNRERRSTLLVVTHNPDLASMLPRTLRMVDGGLEDTAEKVH